MYILSHQVTSQVGYVLDHDWTTWVMLIKHMQLIMTTALPHPLLPQKQLAYLLPDFCVKKFYWQQIWTEADTAYTNEGCSNNHLIHTTVLKSEKFDWQFSIFAYTAEREINAYHWCTVLLLPYIAYNTQKYRHTRWYRWHKNLPLCLWVAAIRTCY